MTNPEIETLVVGAGILGCAIADELSVRGHKVSLVDSQTPGHEKSASGDSTRILRSGYGANSVYTARAWRAHSQWNALAERVGEELVISSGAVWLASSDGDFENATYQELSRQEIPAAKLSSTELRSMFPSLETEDLAFGIFEKDAGVLRARRCVEVLAASAVDRGAEILRGTARPTSSGEIEIDGSRVTAKNVVWAAGAWMSGLFPGIVDTHITAQDAVYVPAPGPAWGVDSIPAWIDPSSKRYGLGAENGNLKVASSDVGQVFDPWDGRPAVEQSSVDTALEYANFRFPSLSADSSSHVHPCQYASTADTQFILARHPEKSAWLLVGGDSGHAFKHSLWIAEHVSDLIEGADGDPNFGLGGRDSTRGLRVSSNS